MRYPGFINGSGHMVAAAVNAERTVNLYPERIDGTPKNRYWLRRVPGLRLFSTLDAGPVRALYHQDGRCFAVSGDGFYEIFADGTANKRGIVNVDSRRATIVQNTARQIFIVSGMAGYIFHLDTLAFVPITAAGFPGACLAGAFADQYFLALHSGTPRFSFSGLADGLSWSTTDIAQKSQTTDALMNFIVDHKELWLFGTLTTEVWFNSGDARNPWTPQPILIEAGLGATDSLAKGADSMFWLRGNAAGARKVVRSQGYAAVSIGSPAVHSAINDYTRVDDARGWFYEEGDHGFYVLTFPTAQATWVYDVREQLWHERLSWNTGTGRYDGYRAQCHTSAFDLHLVGDRTTGSVYELTPDALDEGGSPLVWMRQAPHLAADRKTVFYHALNVDAVTGVRVPVTGPGSDPQCMLRYSNDGGNTFGTERRASLGRFGDYSRRVRFEMLGSSDNRVFRLSGSEPAFTGLVDASLDATVGLH